MNDSIYKNIFWFVVGFIAFPAVFVPLIHRLQPNDVQVRLMLTYFRYLRMWGAELDPTFLFLPLN